MIVTHFAPRIGPSCDGATAAAYPAGRDFPDIFLVHLAKLTFEERVGRRQLVGLQIHRVPYSMPLT